MSRTCSSGTTLPLSSQSAANRGRGADRTMACGLIRFFRSQTGGLDSALSIITRSRTMNWFHGSQTDRIWDKNGARWNNRVTEIPPTARRSKLVGKTKIRTHKGSHLFPYTKSTRQSAINMFIFKRLWLFKCLNYVKRSNNNNNKKLPLRIFCVNYHIFKESWKNDWK